MRFVILFIALCYSIVPISSFAQSQEQLNIRMLQAAKNDQADSVKYWLDKGADVNGVDEVGLSSLFYGIANDNYALAEWLIKKEANIQDGFDFTPLMGAAKNGNLRMCYLLYSEGADLKKTNRSRKSAQDYAQNEGYLRVALFLKDPKSYSKEPTCWEYLISSNQLSEESKLTEAVEIAEKAKESALNELRPNHPLYVIILNNLALICNKSYDFKKAEQKYLEALEIAKVAFGKETPFYATILYNLAEVYNNIGDFKSAEPLLLQTMNIRKEVFGEKHADYIACLNNLAVIYKGTGNYQKAEFYSLEATRLYKEMLGAKHSLYALSLNNLAMIYSVFGNYQKAEELLLDAFRIYKETLGEKNIDYITCLNNLGLIYYITGNDQRAEPLLLEAMTLCKETHNEKQQVYALGLNNLALIYFRAGNYQKAVQILLEASKIYKESQRELVSNNALVLNNLAMLYEKEGKVEKSESLYLQALQIKELHGRNNLDYIYISNNLALFYCTQNKYRVAETFLDGSIRFLIQNFNFSFSFLSEKERSVFWYNEIEDFAFYKSFSYNYFLQKPSISTLAYNNELFSKGILLNTSRQIQQAIVSSGDTALLHKYHDLKDMRRRVHFLQSQPIEKQHGLSELETKANELDKELTSKSQPYQQAKAELKIQWQDVQSKLKEGEAAIEFSSFSYYNKQWTDSTLYCALVLKKGMKYPVMVPLCEQKQLDSLWVGGKIAPNLLYASRGVTAEYKDQLPNGKRLYQLIWKPLEKELRDVKTVYYSPSGSLHQVSFAALPTDTANYLCDKYNLVQLSSTRQLATAAWQSKPMPISSTVLFGGIKYDLESQELTELQRSLPKNETNNSRGFKPDSTRSSIAFGFLQGTKDEVETISATLQTNRIKSTLYTGINGNEETFKALSNQNVNVLHIATHGFFNPIEKEKPQDLDRMMLMDEQRFRYSPNPLLRSGLILAGGNRTWKGQEPQAGMEDGILTAQEISEMDLHQTELVVLSACETGLGDVNGGEGVFGLQRAFKLAGVKTIIMSLWKVDDKATAEMMQLFYSKWLDGMDKREAFRLAQQELKKKKNYSEPYYWAGFVMVD